MILRYTFGMVLRSTLWNGWMIAAYLSAEIRTANQMLVISVIVAT